MLKPTQIVHPDLPTDLIKPSDPVLRDRLLDEAEAEIEAGRGVPHEKVRVWLAALAAGRRLPPPCAE